MSGVAGTLKTRPSLHVRMALSRVVSEIFDVEKCRDLEISIKAHSRSSESTGVDQRPMINVPDVYFIPVL